MSQSARRARLAMDAAAQGLSSVPNGREFCQWQDCVCVSLEKETLEYLQLSSHCEVCYYLNTWVEIGSENTGKGWREVPAGGGQGLGKSKCRIISTNSK